MSSGDMNPAVIVAPTRFAAAGCGGRVELVAFLIGRLRQSGPPFVLLRGLIVKRFDAVFRRNGDGEVLLKLPLEAATIQAAIDEAKASGAARRLGADSLDILADGEKVETVGVGAEPYKT